MLPTISIEGSQATAAMATATSQAAADCRTMLPVPRVDRRVPASASTTTTAKISAMALTKTSPTSSDMASGHTAEARG